LIETSFKSFLEQLGILVKGDKNEIASDVATLLKNLLG
jgi:hypothetical protein